MDSLLSRVHQTLERRGLLRGAGVEALLARGSAREQNTVLVACSGGPDSQVLLHALWALREVHGARLVAASVDHGLRAEAAAEQALAARLAGELGVPFVSLSVRLAKGASLQARARAARYAALRACAREHGAPYIAVGHTLDDQAETVLARILRGTGLEGLRGIQPRRDDGVVRPLIDARRREVLDYAQRHRLSWAEDPSNRDPRFLRARIRHTLLPLLSAENPRLSEQLAALSEDVREVAGLLAPAVERAEARLFSEIAAVREEPAYLRRSALKSVAEKNTGRAIQRIHLVALERMLREGGQVRLPGDTIASIDAEGRLCFSRVEKRGRGVARRTEESD
jgi:tRNA(Ile)-lysidine synthase